MIMRRNRELFFGLFLSVLAVVGFASCSGGGTKEEVKIDDAVEKLIGKWQRPSPINEDSLEYYRYDKDGFGFTWDTGDDVTETEAQEFQWELELNTEKTKKDQPYILTHIHIMEMGASVPKVYGVTKLTAKELVYVDDYGNLFSFTKSIVVLVPTPDPDDGGEGGEGGE